MSRRFAEWPLPRFEGRIHRRAIRRYEKGWKKNLSCGRLNGAHAFVMRHILSILPAFPVIKLVVVGTRH